MAWTAPLTFNSTMVTAAILNTHIKDYLLVLSTHNHTGSAGIGGTALGVVTISSQNYFQMTDQSANPGSTGILQRNGANLVYHNGAVVSLSADAAAGTASLRSLGSGSTQAAAGNHSH